jgi:predicted metal-dependent phosphoesterase TrpH
LNQGQPAGGIDLHIHSTVSDGSLTPDQLVRTGKELGLEALALTDHDTVDGLDEFLAAAQRWEMEAVTGVEISVDALNQEERPISLHILGYFIDHCHPGLQAGLRRLIDNRDQRNRSMADRLRQIGCPITLEAAERFKTRPGPLGRPHFASALVAAGYAQTIEDAFQRFLRRGAPGYVEKKRLTIEEGINLILQAGGLPALAHPGSFLAYPVFFNRLLERLKAWGVQALECYYVEYNDEKTKALLDLAERFDLVPCGGSDFHGQMKPQVQMGSGRGWLKVPYQVLPRLRQRSRISRKLEILAS